MGKLNSKQKREKAKKIIQDLGITERRKFLVLICNKCGRSSKVRTSDKSMYTEEIIKNWKCAFCSIKS